MHQYFVDKKLTLVGPIDSTHTKVFGSLTYYMLMPFTVLGNFNPVSPIYGTAFFGVITVIILLLLTKQINNRLILPIALLLIAWFPLLQASRWAWNPHLMPFWISLGIWLYFKNKTWSFLLSGICFGLAFHLHYISLVATVPFIILVAASQLRKKDFKKATTIVGGYILTVLPFLIFDLRHPPGLFFTHYLHSNETSAYYSQNLIEVLAKISQAISGSLLTIFQNRIIALIGGGAILALFVGDFLKQKKYLLFVLPLISSIIANAYLVDYQPRYILAALPFFLIWLVFPRNGHYKFLGYTLIGLLIIGSLFSIVPQLTKPIIEPDIATINQATSFIKEEITKNNLQNVNVASLASPDRDPNAVIYRDLLLINGVTLESSDQYQASDTLFVISTSDEQTVRQDPASIMSQFRKGQLQNQKAFNNWHFYEFKKSPS